MKRFVLLAALSALPSVVLTVSSCESREIPNPDIKISLSVDAKGLPPDAGFIFSSTEARLVAHVTAPPGLWTVALSLGGAASFALPQPGVDAGPAAQATFTSNGQPVELPFFLRPSARGTAYATATISNATATTSFAVVSDGRFDVELCASDPDEARGCIDAGSVGVAADAGIPGLPPRSPTIWSVGELVPLLIDATESVAGANDAGALRVLHLRTEGAVALSQDGGSTAAEDTPLSSDVAIARRQLVVQDVGAGRVSAWINEGAPTALDLLTSPSVAGVWQVQALGTAGSLTTAHVRVCSSSRTGSVPVSASDGTIVGDAGTLTLTQAAPTDCPPGYRGRGDLVWRGASDSVVWTTQPPRSPGVTTIQAVAMPNAITSVRAALIGSLVWSATDAGTVKQSRAQVRIARDIDADAGPGIERALVDVVGVPPAVTVTLDNVRVGTSSAETDDDGIVTMLISAPANQAAFDLVLRVDGRLRTVLTLPGP